MTKIAIFASGSGSNAENIIQYFQGIQGVDVVLVLSNRKESYVLTRALKYSIPTFVFTKNELNNTTKVLDYLHKLNASILILAGFLLKIPNNLANDSAVPCPLAEGISACLHSLVLVRS